MKSCLFCGKELTDKRRSYCNDACKASFLSGEIPESSATPKWRAKEVLSEEDIPMHISASTSTPKTRKENKKKPKASAKPKERTEKAPRAKKAATEKSPPKSKNAEQAPKEESLEEMKIAANGAGWPTRESDEEDDESEDEIDEEGDESEEFESMMATRAGLPPPIASPPRENQRKARSVHRQDTSEKTYETYRKDPQVWVAGESWFEVFVFDGDFDDEFDGDWESSSWIAAIPRCFDDMPIEDLKDTLVEEHGSGVYQIRFMKSGINRPRKVKPPFLIKIEGNSMGRRARMDLLEQERSRSMSLEQAVLEREKEATDRALTLQERLLSESTRKEEALRKEIEDLRKKDSVPDQMIQMLKDQHRMSQEELRQQRLRTEEAKRESSQKDRDLFQMVLDQNVKAEKARLDEMQRREEAQLRFAEVLSSRDAQFMQAIANLKTNDEGGGMNNDMMLMMMQQQQKSFEMMMLQQQESSKQQISMLQQSAESQKSMMMMMFANNDKSKDQNPVYAMLMKQLENTEKNLSEARAQHNELMLKLVEKNNTPSDVGGIKSAVEAVKALRELQEMSSPHTNREDEQEPEAPTPPPDGFLDKAKEIAQAINLGRVVEAIGKRIERGGEPQAPSYQPRPPTVSPPANAYSNGATSHQIPPSPNAGQLPRYNQTTQPTETTHHQPAAATSTHHVHPSAGQSEPMGEESEIEVLPEVMAIFEGIEQSILRNVSPKDWVATLDPLQAMLIKKVNKEEIVDTVEKLSGSDVIASMKGRRWLKEARDVLYG